MASIFPAGGVLDVLPFFTQPTNPANGNCVRYYDPNCQTPLDMGALNSQIKEILNIVDLQGLTWDCGSHSNLFDAICHKVCTEITDRIYTQTVSGGGTQTLTLPSGGSWDYHITYDGGEGGFAAPTPWVWETDDENQNWGGSESGNAAGGTSFPVTHPSGYAGIMSIFAIRVGDC